MASIKDSPSLGELPVSHVENSDDFQPNDHEQYILERHGTLNLDPLPSASPDDPLNWPNWKKNIQIFMVVCHAAMNTFCAAACIPAFPNFAIKYGISVDQATYLTSVQVGSKSTNGRRFD
jgi:hypothetical protein